ncbi:MAG: hypothetical protein A2X52_04065 [Candidatus Rokubacteria bacterium GWC2_70_16]|nr:MAG: hypothetical protein A2X52_04065 [Candidatus Rokubacteria bacterium GWC2_70_16]OGL17260.1 MAG: hypothetical protein A3K12_11000 [Candidatus Rokubacteria bacterium RIFCSPLOWO2_12_FULL_71_19]
MSPGGHLVTTALACGAVHALTGSPALTAGLAAGGFLIDVDHAVDYVLVEGRRDLRPSAFLRYYLGGEARRVVLALHSYELLALLALLAWVTNSELGWGYVLGMLLHLPLDIVFNGKLVSRSLVPFYSLAYRWRAGFLTSRLVGGYAIAPSSPEFWDAFFQGAVATGAARGAPLPGQLLSLPRNRAALPLEESLT